MLFADFEKIHLFWFLMAVILFYFWAIRRKKAIMKKFARKDLLEELSSSLSPLRQRVKAVLVILAIALCLLALMRPQYGFHWEQVKRQGLDIIIALDTSKSMLAEDVKPNRLERSKLAIKDLLKKLRGDRVGLVAFSGEAFVQCPLTVDYSGFLLALNSVDSNIIPNPGTSISSAISEAARSYEPGQKKYKVLIIITDGEDHEGDPLAAAEKAAKEGVVIFCVGIGTGEGELVPVVNGEGKREFLKDREGNFVKSRLDEKILEKIAFSSSGSYVRASGAGFGLDALYEEKIAVMEKREFEGKMRKRHEERFQLVLAVVLLVLAVEPFISTRKSAGAN